MPETQTWKLRYTDPFVRPGKTLVGRDDKVKDLSATTYAEAEKEAENFLSLGGVVVGGKTHKREQVGELQKGLPVMYPDAVEVPLKFLQRKRQDPAPMAYD